MRGLYIAEAAMLTQQARLNIISNNLANQQTAGYKRDESSQFSFAEWLICCQGGRAAAGPSSQPLGEITHSVAIDGIQTVLSSGGITETGRELDFALDGGCFTVEGPEGLLYTSNGRFFLDREGFLVTADNLPVVGERGRIRLADMDLTVDQGGVIYSRGREVDRPQTVVLSSDDNLEKVGNSYFRTLDGAPLPAQRMTVYWRCLEGSNVDLTREMVSLIQVRRSYEAAQKVMTGYDQLLNRAANELGALS